ncbi:hypothetical protein BDN72DRAFT_394917 [Pluteus cervinus]|uniref:Uncharacterized protein n=1 Tax=Pluteus cervinus TaxID=181527 RepID=A0ACD3B252_9AGAR|nr:hypothetical protein BDN72DRAFT_394917 [Pluteus cervinus]
MADAPHRKYMRRKYFLPVLSSFRPTSFLSFRHHGPCTMDQDFKAEALSRLGLPLHWFIAPPLIGCLLNYFLLGALTVQVYDYFLRFHAKDRLGLKCVVYGVYLMELVATGLVTITAYDLVLGSWGEVLHLINCPNTSSPNVVVNNAIALIVQLFFAWRILCLRQSWFAKIGAALTVITAIFSMITSGLFVRAYVRINQGDIHNLTATVNLWIVSAFICDSVIAITMVSLLWRARAATNYQQTKTVLNHLIVHTIETGGATAIVALAELSLFLYSPHSYLHLSMFYILGRIYSNALLASVNGRQRMRTLLDGGADHPCVASLHLPPTTRGAGSEGYDDSSRTDSSQPGFMVLMKTTVHTHDDDTPSIPTSKSPSTTDLHKNPRM